MQSMLATIHILASHPLQLLLLHQHLHPYDCSEKPMGSLFRGGYHQVYINTSNLQDSNLETELTGDTPLTTVWKKIKQKHPFQ